MRKLCYLILLITILNIDISYSQKAQLILKKANDLYMKEFYKESLPFFLQVVKIEPTHAEANYKAGKIYIKTTDHFKALPYLKKAYETMPSIASDIKFLLATSYQDNNLFEAALMLYKSMSSENRESNSKEVERKIYECENGIEYLKQPIKVRIENMGSIVNSKYKDFAPVISADESVLVFTSRRAGIPNAILDEHKESYEDIYISYKKNGKWTTAENIGKPINTRLHNASIAISPDGRHIFIFKSVHRGDIFISSFSEGKWSKPEDLGKNINTKYSEKSCSMSADGKTLFFSSNKPNGKGGIDIYISKKDEKGKWKEVKNIGPIVNTEFDEDAPFIHPDGKTLYFSSKGHAGMGKYDIYKTTLQIDGSWSNPVNMGYPINTADDDIFFVLSADNKHGYYASERVDGYGETDLYMISMPQADQVFIEAEKIKNTKEEIAIAKMESFNPITILIPK